MSDTDVLANLFVMESVTDSVVFQSKSIKEIGVVVVERLMKSEDSDNLNQVNQWL